MDTKTREKLALTYHNQGFNCAQSVLVSFADDFSLDRDMALRIAGTMGGGIRSGEVCGAVLGASCAVGLQYGHDDPEDVDSKAKCSEKAEELICKFKEIHDNVCCRDLLGYDINALTQEQFNEQREQQAKQCQKYICDCVKIADEIIKEN